MLIRLIQELGGKPAQTRELAQDMRAGTELLPLACKTMPMRTTLMGTFLCLEEMALDRILPKGISFSCRDSRQTWGGMADLG